jgi:hypothetical protein
VQSEREAPKLILTDRAPGSLLVSRCEEGEAIKLIGAPLWKAWRHVTRSPLLQRRRVRAIRQLAYGTKKRTI